jgi:hypothetical protein
MLPNSDTPIGATSNSQFPRILLIRPAINTHVYRDAVLRSAGFLVEVAIPTELPSIVNDGIASYSVVVISDALPVEDVLTISVRLRQSCPKTKIILMEGRDSLDVDPRLYDAVVGNWSGPRVLISAVQRLIAQLASIDG